MCLTVIMKIVGLDSVNTVQGLHVERCTEKLQKHWTFRWGEEDPASENHRRFFCGSFIFKRKTCG